MQPLPAEAKRVYKVEEIAAILRVSPETIYRKIESAELSALDLTTDDQKQYRVARSALIAWLGEQRFYELFTPSDASGVVCTLLNSLSESEKTELFDRAIAWARERRAERPLMGRTATAEEIRARFSAKWQ